MAIEKRTVIDQIEIRPDGCIGVRMAKQVVEDGVVIASQWHRSAVEPGGDVDAQFALVNEHLSMLGATQVESSEIARVKEVAGLVHKPEIVQAYRKKTAINKDERKTP